MNHPPHAPLDELDKAILNQIQSFFPIAVRPYQVVGDKLGLSEDKVLERVQRMVQDGVIRRIGANFNSRRLGYTRTLMRRPGSGRSDRTIYSGSKSICRRYPQLSATPPV